MLNLHADTFGITRLEYQAVRACEKLLGIATAGWDEMHGCDRHFDGGEWSDEAWANNFDTEIARVANLVAGRFGLDAEKLRTTWEYHAPYDEEGFQQDALRAKRDALAPKCATCGRPLLYNQHVDGVCCDCHDKYLQENHLALMCGEANPMEEF